tara:strand:+ start:483 stop:713 length:231 start_codon:yes stop_codon:yes gene_type:complete
MTLHLRYFLPLDEKEKATLNMYYSSSKSKRLIKVLGGYCAVYSIEDNTSCSNDGVSPSELKVDIKLKQVYIVKDRL